MTEDWNDHPCPECKGQMKVRVRTYQGMRLGRDMPYCAVGCDLGGYDPVASADCFSRGDYCEGLTPKRKRGPR